MSRSPACIAAIVVGLVLGAGLASAQPPAVVINEVLFNPSGPDSTREWVELHNSGPTTLWTGGWTIAGADAAVDCALPDIEMPPGSFLVVRFGTGPSDLDLSDGSGVFVTYFLAPAFGNESDACALYQGPPLLSMMLDFVAWSAVGGAPAGPAVLDAVAQGQWPAPGVCLDTSFGGGRFVAPWTEDQGESIGRNRFAADSNQPLDWCDHGGADALAATEGRANTGPVFLAGDLVPYAQSTVNQFLWEFAYNITWASHAPISSSQSDTYTSSLDTHSFATMSRFTGLLKVFTGNIDCHWVLTDSDRWQVEASGMLVSGDGPEALEFTCLSGERHAQTQLVAEWWRTASLTYTDPLGQIVTRQLDFTTSTQWNTPIELLAQDLRYVNDSRDLVLTRSTTGRRFFPDDAHEDMELTAETSFLVPAGWPSETFEAAASKIHLASGGVIGTLHAWTLDTGYALHLAGPGSFQATAVTPDSLVFVQSMTVGNEDLGYRSVELRGFHGGRELPSGEYHYWGRNEIEVFGQPVSVLTSYVDGPWWKNALRIVSATAWGVGCFAGTVVGAPTVVGAGVAVGACAAGGIATDIVIEEVCPKKGRALADGHDLPPPLWGFPRLVCGPPTGVPLPPSAPELLCGPNPGSGATSVQYMLPRAETVSLAIYDAAGRRVRVLQQEAVRPAGPHSLLWDGRADDGRPVPAGTYLCRLTTATYRMVAKLAMLR
jgi:hypothetical protein